MGIDTRDFRNALGKFATGVTVITTKDAEGEHYGVTASSFNAVSMTPPLILWSIDKGAYSKDVYCQAEHFVVNVLASNQVPISNRFAQRGENKFKDIDVEEGLGGSARIVGAVAHFECRTWQVYEGGDHFIIVGEVLNYDYQDGCGSLVFHGGRYALPEPHPMMLPEEDNRTSGGVLGQHFLYLLRQSLAAYRQDFYPRLGHLGVNQKEWRILTLLLDRGPQPIDQVAQGVAQPLEDCEDTLNGLACRDLVVESGDQRNVSLTSAGNELAGKLLNMAREHEQKLFDSVSDEEVRQMKSGLAHVIEQLGSR
ncbi:flavin reductase [Halomonas halocynthiae]|uniref:flavin reductase n=1 Tax=Halomonas halocynthiae TaxID=176290 RepID=UPI000400F786|nr:flavin reductase [Halomonas halocynthiae]